MAEEFETKRERELRQNRERVNRFKNKHGCKQLKIDFIGNEIDDFLVPFNRTLRQDGVTHKDFVVRSFEEYRKRGGFNV